MYIHRSVCVFIFKQLVFSQLAGVFVVSHFYIAKAGNEDSGVQNFHHQVWLWLLALLGELQSVS